MFSGSLEQKPLSLCSRLMTLRKHIIYEKICIRFLCLAFSSHQLHCPMCVNAPTGPNNFINLIEIEPMEFPHADITYTR